jgi:hypothetical protein
LFEITLSITDQRGGCKDRSGAIHGAKRQGGEAIRFRRERPMTFPDHFSGHADRYGDFPPPNHTVVKQLYADVWKPLCLHEIQHMEDGYGSLPSSFDEVTPPRFHLVQ